MKTEKKIICQNDQQYIIVKAKPRWYIEYYELHPMDVHERIRVYGWMNRIKDFDKREEKAIEIIKLIAAGAWYKDQGQKNILLTTLLDLKPLLRKKSFSTYKTKVTYFINWLTGRDPLKINTSDANEFLRALLRFKKHESTVLAYKRTLFTIYKRTNSGINPFEETITLRKRYTSKMFFNKDQINALKKYFLFNDVEMWMAIQLLYYCFIRPGEMRLLKISDINLEEQWIEIRAEISKNKKTQKVRIPNACMNLLKPYVQSRPNPYGLLFSKDPDGKISVSDKHFNDAHANGLLACKIFGRYSFYSWKHTGAVAAIKGGINIKDLQLQLRHHSLDQVNEYLKDLGIMDNEDLKIKFPTL